MLQTTAAFVSAAVRTSDLTYFVITLSRHSMQLLWHWDIFFIKIKPVLLNKTWT
jgi:hypothetical protein